MVLQESRMFENVLVDTERGFFQYRGHQPNYGTLKKVCGYYGIKLALKGTKKKKNWYVHRAIMTEHSGSPIPKSLEVMHTVPDRSMNGINNLALGTKKNNCKEAATRRDYTVAGNTRRETGYSIPVIAKNTKSGKEYSFSSARECAKNLGVSASTICKIIKGRPYYKHSYDALGKQYSFYKKPLSLTVP